MRGHVRKRGSKWAVIVFLGLDDSGKRKYKWFSGFETKKEAEKALVAKLQEVNTGTYIEATKETLGDYMNRWLQDKKSQVRPGTYRKYSWLVNRHIIPQLGKIELAKLKPQHLQSFYTGLRAAENPLSNRSILHAHLVLHDALDRAVKWGLVPQNIADAVEPPKPERVQMSVWTRDDVLRFLEAAKTSPHYIVFLLAVTTGMRKGEILGLRWSDLDLDNGRLYVRQSLTYVDGQPVFLDPKTNKGKRMVALSPEVVVQLRRYKTNQAKDKLRLGPLYKDYGMVITRPDGSPASVNTLDKQWYALLEESGLPRIRFHDLRHTHASLLLEQGVHPKIVSERLGHSTINITLDTYSHVLPGLQEQVAKDFGDALFGKTLDTERLANEND